MTRARTCAWAAGAALLLALAVTAHLYCAGRPAHGQPQYVAMGSSFAAGPAVGEPAEGSPWFCWRSRDNYAHQLARLRGLSLVDVSCGGATTAHLLGGGLLMQPPQIEAVTAETRLVTLTIGGNDLAYIGNMMAMACNGDTAWVLRKTAACRIRSSTEMESGLSGVLDNLGATIDEIHRRAPQAQVVLVNYLTVLPAQGTCERLGLGAAQVAQMRGIAEKLAEVTYAAAEGHGALLLDARRLSQGHDVCAPEPWINGMHPPRGLMGAPLHPTLAGMSATAQALNTLLGQP